MAIDPEVAQRMAKLLRLACDRAATDGEKVSAIGKLSAIALANNVDWDTALNGKEISRDDMQRIFDAGYERGAADTRQELKPARDWTPTAGTSAAVGHDFARLRAILDAAATADDNGDLTDWESTFTTDMTKRAKQYGVSTYVSGKQWESLDRLAQKLEWNGYL